MFKKIFFKPQSNNLIIGFAGKIDGWLTLDIVPGADYLGDIRKMNIFSSNSMDKIYASHVLEHLNCHDAKIAMKEIGRVLKPGGEIFLVVPDMLRIANLLDTKSAETVIDIIYGVRRHDRDWVPQHKYGYTRGLMAKLMEESGFVDIGEFEPFIEDTSTLCVDGTKISLCLKGKKY